jgi:hypothetical protein
MAALHWLAARVNGLLVKQHVKMGIAGVLERAPY